MGHALLRGGIRGGLGLTSIVIGILLAASTGIVGASVVLLAVLSMPIMLQNNYNKALASGVVAASGTLGILIPPSIRARLCAPRMKSCISAWPSKTANQMTVKRSSPVVGEKFK